MRALVLDFDGVISDSARECFVVALRTYLDLEPRSTLRASTAPATRERCGWGAETEALFERFVALMPLGNRAEDFGVALVALDRGANIADQTAYDAFYATCGEPWRGRFHTLFYEHRHAFIASDTRAWLALNRPYEQVITALRRRPASVTPAIATAKDRASLRLLLDEYGIGDLFPERLVLDKETGMSKRAHMQAIAAALALPFAAITFLDDKLNHLDAVRDLGVRCALATWGYNGPREREQARARGDLLCTLETLEAQLFTA